MWFDEKRENVLGNWAEDERSGNFSKDSALQNTVTSTYRGRVILCISLCGEPGAGMPTQLLGQWQESLLKCASEGCANTDACQTLMGRARILSLLSMSLGPICDFWPEEVLVGCSTRWE